MLLPQCCPTTGAMVEAAHRVPFSGSREYNCTYKHKEFRGGSKATYVFYYRSNPPSIRNDRGKPSLLHHPLFIHHLSIVNVHVCMSPSVQNLHQIFQNLLFLAFVLLHPNS